MFVKIPLVDEAAKPTKQTLQVRVSGIVAIQAFTDKLTVVHLTYQYQSKEGLTSTIYTNLTPAKLVAECAKAGAAPEAEDK